MPEYETIPAEENTLPKTSIRRVIVCAAALSFVLGAVAATAVGSTSTAGAMDLHTTKIWDTCDWIESNSNGGSENGEHEVGDADSPSECIAMVQKKYPDATIANIDGSGAGSCWAQYGSKPTKDKLGWKSCVLASMATKISDAHITLISSMRPGHTTKCITATDSSDLVLAECGTGNGKGHHSKQRFNYQYKSGKGQIELRDHQDSGLSMLSVDMWGCWDVSGRVGPCNALLWYSENNNRENVHWDTTTKQIKGYDSNGKELCLTVASSQKLLWYTCDNSDLEKWQIGDAP